MGALLHALHDREPLPAPRVVEVNEITALICRLPQTHENLVALLSCVEGVFSNAMDYVPARGAATAAAPMRRPTSRRSARRTTTCSTPSPRWTT